MPAPTVSPESRLQPIEASLHQAIILQQAGELLEAGLLYKRILQADPAHPEANHGLGLIAMQVQQTEAGLNYLAAALEADPARGRYWVSYIDALAGAGRSEEARSVLALARQHGLEGDEADRLATRLAVQEAGDADSAVEPASSEASDFTSSPAARGGTPDRRDVEMLLAHFNSGRFPEALNLAETLVQRHPSDAFCWKALGAVLKTLGRHSEALAPMQKAATLAPDDPEAHFNLGVVLQQEGRGEEAEACYRRVIELDPAYADAWLNLGVILQQLDRLDDAERCMRALLRLRPDAVEAHVNLGAILEAQGDISQAEAAYRHAVTIQPDAFEALLNLGRILRGQGRFEQAEACLIRAIAIDASDARVHAELALSLQQLERLEEADRHFLEAIRLNPEDVAALGNRGNLLCQMERFTEAGYWYGRALDIDPNNAELWGNLGKLFKNVGQLEEAEKCFRHALRLDPDNLEILNRLGLILRDRGRLHDAEACFRRILSAEPNASIAMSNLGCTLLGLGRLEEAAECFRKAITLAPDRAMTHSNLLYTLTLGGLSDPQSLFAEHVKFGERFEAPFRAGWPVHTNTRHPERRLQIGFVSADFYDHAVASFIEPVLAELSKYPGLSLHAYYNHFINDAVTKRLRQHFAHWHGVSGMGDEALAEKIRTDEIDILIDLSGHTGFNRLTVFARKPAPLQASWIGYPATTGLRAIDYYLADRFLVPPGTLEDQFTEKVIRLPANAPFAAFDEAPPVNALPALDHGYVTFGSFNRPDKISRDVVALWARLLRARPDSRMLLGGMPETGYRDKLIGWLAEEGIAAERVDVHLRSNMKNYMALHHQVDICLDTMPYNGGTTSLHALWMGVPTLTMVGDTMAARVGAAVMSQVGHPDFIADCADDFVARGVSWTDNLSDLAAVRAGLRERLVQSPLGKPEWVAAGLNHALRGMWRRWCAGLPAEAFELPPANTATVDEFDQ